ncbi:uncharacterized protein SCODWIG_01318 [Saccharomycodes ludwigii]|uniref:Exosome complex protein n=1 Tax=Saccharomycodes ludwigii TaxID=36035 RepID=A0A376B4D2_9ASCO|nr:hypothetical protein SCDLUD_004735 [Saccharomycodes ludwigii]KAH3899298.1 hypothetical protein SCDLUD_004735 [Saccharomycodes ludwigii]SSD59557.1 uncharacterized protein SCODWIG_01318 [Saccharomycodes ludwigii]
MAEETIKFNKYVSYLNKQLDSLLNSLQTELINKSLDDKLMQVTTSNNATLNRLEICNKYAYVLSSLLFVYMKLNNTKDLSPILKEISRVRSYMDEANKLKDLANIPKQNDEKKKSFNHSSISEQNFTKGKHTRFNQTNEEGSSLKDNILEKLHKKTVSPRNTKSLSSSTNSKKPGKVDKKRNTVKKGK